jgi:succinoglycan biosynthesis protein ExoA
MEGLPDSKDWLAVICPTYNEANSIESVLQFFVSALPVEKELWVVDGGSTDGTTEIVKDWAMQHPNIHLLPNPHKIVPHALNLGIQASKGSPVVRLDAHTEYAPDYFEAILRTFQATQADIVGGPMRPRGETPVQQAIGHCSSCVFGIGDSQFHQEQHEGWVESVYLGAWKRAIFEQIGYFETDLVRNQDDEFHYRAKQKGLKIYLHPEIRSYYTPRDSLKKLFHQYGQYGFYKPLVIKKVRQGMRLRHLIPAGFVLYLFSLPIMLFWPWWILPLAIYTGLDLYFSLSAKVAWPVRIIALTVFPILHIAYGWGFLRGLWHWNIHRK